MLSYHDIVSSLYLLTVLLLFIATTHQLVGILLPPPSLRNRVEIHFDIIPRPTEILICVMQAKPPVT